MSKNFDIGYSWSVRSDLLFEQLRIFPIEIGKKFCHEKILDHVKYMFV